MGSILLIGRIAADLRKTGGLLGTGMRSVGAAANTVEWALRAGRLRCPGCAGTLRPWGCARPRPVHLLGAPDVWLRPRRTRCGNCRQTHVLLPDWTLPRRAYAAPVIWQVLLAHAHGAGYRRTALRLRLPESTVRDWLRAFRRLSPGQCAELAGQGHSPGTAVLALELDPQGLPAWLLAVRRTSGNLLRNTKPPHPERPPPSSPVLSYRP